MGADQLGESTARVELAPTDIRVAAGSCLQASKGGQERMGDGEGGNEWGRPAQGGDGEDGGRQKRPRVQAEK